MWSKGKENTREEDWDLLWDIRSADVIAMLENHIYLLHEIKFEDIALYGDQR